MAEGMARREATQDNLAGQAGMEPVYLRGQGVTVPKALPIDQAPGMAAELTQQLSKWSGSKFGEAQQKANKRALMEGQMAHVQGKTLEQVEMGGNQWALEGYRVMDAQTMASSMLTAQREMIAQSDFQMDPEAYRAEFIGRVDQMLEGLDERTADLVREQMTNQMPTLVADHTAQHMRYMEEQNYNSLVNGVETISRDPTASAELLSYAQGGPGSASEGLAPERRTAAVVDGVVKAFTFDNPMAYATLAANGLLGADTLTVGQHQQIEAAKAAFENRRRNEWNQELMAGTAELEEAVLSGDLDPTVATERYMALLAEHEITGNQQDAASVFNPAREAQRDSNKAAFNDFEAAALRGDWNTMATIMEPIIMFTESGNDPNAVSPKGAKGLMQVMDGTNTDPGFGVIPARDGSAEERVRVGKDYWRTMMGGSAAHPKLKWQAGDLDAALIAYNAGPGVANKFIASGRDYNMLPAETQDYIKKNRDRLGSWQGLTAKDKLALSQERLTAARKAVAADQYDQFAQTASGLDKQFVSGALTESQWREQRRAAADVYGQERTKAMVDQELSVVAEVDSALAKAAEQAQSDDEAIRLNNARGEVSALMTAFTSRMSQPGVTEVDIAAGLSDLTLRRQQVMDEYGIAEVDRKDGDYRAKAVEMATNLIDKAQKRAVEQALIDRARHTGTVGELPTQALKDEAFRQIAAEAQQGVQEAVASNQMTEDQAMGHIAANLNAGYAEAGAVPSQVNKEMTAAITRGILGKDGKPNPMALDAINQYMQLDAMNPIAAATMLGEKERQLADMVIEEAGGNPAALQEAMVAVGSKTLEFSGKERPQDFAARDSVQKRITSTAKDLIKADSVGYWQALFSSNSTIDQRFHTTSADHQRRMSPENINKLSDALQREMEFIYANHPFQGEETIAKTAERRLKERTAVIGGDLFIAPKGTNLVKEFFGADGQDFVHDGAYNSAIMGWLMDPATQEQYPRLKQGAAFWGDFVFGDLTLNEVLETNFNRNGVRPFEVTPAGDGRHMHIYVDDGDGGAYEPIIVPMREVGDHYRTLREGELTQ